MKYFAIVLFVQIFSVSQNLKGQEVKKFEPHGKGSGLIFANFHKGITEMSSDESAFELVRAYLGYEHFISPEYSARITLDIGSPDDISPFSRIRRYAYFKYAYAQYAKNKVTLEFGLIGTQQFKLQERLWERRYIKKAFADEYKLGSSADLGSMISYKFNKSIEADFTVMNGEGYSKLQLDDKFKYGLGLTWYFRESLINRVYVDYMNTDVEQTTFTWVTSYTHKKNLNLVFEYNYQQNHNITRGRDLFGYSIYGKYNFTPQFQLFARYDMLNSNILEGATNPWHLAEDGSTLISGLQFTPVKGIKMALNYQDWVPRAVNMTTRSFIYLDMEIRL
jgi:hypothetical protein